MLRLILQPSLLLLLFLTGEEKVSAMDLISRANCGNNESITWDKWQRSYKTITASSHHAWNSGNSSHSIMDHRKNDNSAKAIHWGEGAQFKGNPNRPGRDYWIATGSHAWVDQNWQYNGSSYNTWC